MSLRSHLIHTCVIARRTPTGETDSHGNPAYAWVEGEPTACRLVSRQMWNAEGVAADVTAAGQYRVLLPAGTALSVGDRLTVTADGVTLPQRYRVEGVLPRRARTQHHVTALVEAVG